MTNFSPTQKIMRSGIAGVLALTVSACAGGGSSRLDAADALQNAPIAQSQSQIRQYAELFKRACLDGPAGYTNAEAQFAAAGMKKLQGAVSKTAALEGAYSDGVAFAALSVGHDGRGECKVSFKTPDDDPVVKELRRVVSSSRYSSAKYSRSGLFGAGYAVDLGKTAVKIITVFRQQRSIHSPTSFMVIDAGKR